MMNPDSDTHVARRTPGRWRTVFVCAAVFVALAIEWVNVLIGHPCASAWAAEDPFEATFDLSDPSAASRWSARHDIGNVTGTPDGLRIEITGADPYMQGPLRSFPSERPLLLEMRLKSDTGGTAQVFYFQRGPSEANSVRFAVPAGRSYDAVVPLPPLGAGYRFRFDPPGTSGICTVERMRVVTRSNATPPPAPPFEPFTQRDDDWRLVSGDCELRHARQRWSKFELNWRGRRVAISHAQPVLGISRQSETRWIKLYEQSAVETDLRDGRLVSRMTLASPDAPAIRLEQVFKAQSDGAIDVSTSVEVDVPCDVIHLPTLVVLPGVGTHGPRKSQALFAGVEYLSDEPSRSTADLEGPAAHRLVPASHKITFPLMAIQHDGHFVSLIWTPAEHTAALFDSPDRTLGSGAHAMGLLAPGASSSFRADGDLVAYRPLRLVPGQPLRQSATIVVGGGDNVTAAVADYVKRRGLPAVPRTPPLESYVRLAAAGWLDSPLRDGDRFRHAVGNSFPAQPAMDAAWMLRWLGESTTDAGLRDRIYSAARGAATAVPAGHEYHSHVGHLKPPVAGLTVAPFEVTAAQARAVARGQLGVFGPDGIARYQPPRDGIDYSRTQPSREASGYAALPVAVMLEAAAYAGDEELVTSALERLGKLDRYVGDVPRGAQTWEIALHTPDILASAHMVRAYALAFRLTGDKRWLELARYWAWTGVPFVYLRPPAEGEVGPYATTAVLGATQWQQPIWIGLPVQWCGLVYADSLRWLEPHDPTGPWRQLADGITASGIAQTYPFGHACQGLLPDSFDLLAQQRNPADINPGTLQPLALRLLTGRPAYSLHVWPQRKLRAYAPGLLEPMSESNDRLTFRFVPWNTDRSQVVVHGVSRRPVVMVDGQAIELSGDHRYLGDAGTLVLNLNGRSPRQIVLEGFRSAPTTRSQP